MNTFTPNLVSMAAATRINATTTSASAALPAGAAPQVLAVNTGVVPINFLFGTSGVAATTACQTLMPGSFQTFTLPNGATHVAAITASGAATLEIVMGAGA